MEPAEEKIWAKQNVNQGRRCRIGIGSGRTVVGSARIEETVTPAKQIEKLPRWTISFHENETNSRSYKLNKEHKEERKRMLSWLSKFCRHIDNGDKWLTDEENLEFFREKMKQQFGWFAD